MKTCPYCGHLVFGEVVADCRGCGNPVPLMKARTKRERGIMRAQLLRHVLVATHKSVSVPKT